VTDPAWQLVDAGRYDDAVGLLRVEVEEAVRECGEDSLDAAIALNRLGVACKFAGRFDEAEAAYARVVPTAERLRDVEPDLYATLLHNLGGLAHSRRDYATAEEVSRRGLVFREAHSRDPLAVAADSAALAAILEGLERWEEAEVLYRRALDERERADDRCEVALTLNGLAAVVRFAGRPEEAEALFERALDLLRAERGETHPDTATVRNNLAMLYNATGRTQQALPLLERAAADLESILGPDHPATRDVRDNRDHIAAALATGS
jgi:tetratricopeptide (TPR) repeat protein